MSEGTLQFRVGLFVILSTVLGVGLLVRFGELRWLWERHYPLAVHFPEAPGVYPEVPVRKSGVRIGKVRKVTFDEVRGGVVVMVDILERHRLRADSQPRLIVSLLGDASIEFSPGQSPQWLEAGAHVHGDAPVSPLELVTQLEQRVAQTLNVTDGTLRAFQRTSQEWGKVAVQVQTLIDGQKGRLDLVVDRAAESLQEFTQAMRTANQVLADPDNQKAIQETVRILPEMVQETRRSIVAIRSAVEKADATLAHLSQATEPLARGSGTLVSRLTSAAGNLDLLLAELNQFSRHLNAEDGSLRKLAGDPELYRNLNRAAMAMDIVLRSLQPITQDLRILSDRLARHPELLGVGGALRGSSGLKDGDEPDPPARPGRLLQTGGRAP